MRNIGEIFFNGHTVIIRELTVKQVAEQIEGIDSQIAPTTLDWMFADTYMPQAALEKIIDEKIENLIDDNTAPSDLEEIYKEAARYNPFLTTALSRMREIADLMRGLVSPGSEKQQSSLSKEDIQISGIMDLASSPK